MGRSLLSLTIVPILLSFALCEMAENLPDEKDACGLYGVCICNSEGTYGSKDYFEEVRCVGLHLVEVPGLMPPETTHLYLQNNEIYHLQEGTLSSLILLKELSFDNNHIVKIPPEFLSNLRNMLGISFAGNQIEDIQEGTFKHQTKLWLLSLEKNKITRIRPGTFAANPSLSFLYLRGNKLKTLDGKAFQHLPNLRWLDLSDNEIEEIEHGAFDSYQYIFVMVIRHNKLSSLPSSLFKWNAQLSIDTINFADNRLTELPFPLFVSSFLSYLENLHLQRNKLEYLPTDVFQGLTELKHLFLFDNNIKRLGDETFWSTTIHKLFLFGNELLELGKILCNDYSAQEIHLYNNPIERVTKRALTGINRAAQVFLDCNTVKQIENSYVNVKCVTTSYSPDVAFQNQWKSDLHGFSCQNLATQQKKCSVCPRGTFGNDFMQCTSCPPGGFYQDDMGSTLQKEGLSCKECPVGTFVRGGSGKSISDCNSCPGGTNKSRHAGFRACYCLDGYARVDRFGPCLVCLEKGTNCTGQDFKTIQPGYFWSWNFEEANMTQYKLFVSNLKNRTDQYSTSDTQYVLELPKVFKCSRPQNCNTSFDSIETKCAEGYKGWLCGRCDHKFYSIINKCFRCPNTNMLWVETICISLLGLTAYHLFTHLDDGKRDGPNHKRSRVDKISSRSKIYLGFYQVLGEFMTSFNHSYIIGNVYLISVLVPYLELNIFRMFIRAQCFHEIFALKFETQFTIALCFPYTLITLSFLYYRIQRFRLEKKYKPSFPNLSLILILTYLKSKVLAVTVILLFITYPSICTVIFQMYPCACETFCYSVKNKHCIKRLRSDYDVRCNDLSIYQNFALLFTLVYIFAFPAIVLLALSKYLHKLPSDKRKHRLLNRRTDEDELECQNKEKEMWVNFLCENYKPQYWYWEVIELSRKVLQTAFIPLLGWENKFTVPLMVCISCFYLTLHVLFMPMKNKFEQNLQMVCLVATFINVLLSALEPAEKYNTALSIGLILLNAIPIATLAGEAMIWLLRGYKLYRMEEREVNDLTSN